MASGQPSRRSALGVEPGEGVLVPGTILQVDGLSAEAARGIVETAALELHALGPGAWLAVGALEPEAARDLIEGAGGDTVACTDLTHARVVFRVAGPGARENLARGCPLDLDSIEPGGAAATMLGPFEAVIRRDRAAEAFDVFVTRSMARSAREWLSAFDPSG